MIYVENGTAILKATDKQWKACVADQLAWFWAGVPIDGYADLPLVGRRSGGAPLVAPGRWLAADWLQEGYERGLFRDRNKSAMVEAEPNVFVSADSHRVSQRFGRWYLTDSSGADVGESQTDIRVLARKNRLEIYWRFI